MANNEIHIKDFYDIDEGLAWSEKLNSSYDPVIWESEIEIRLLSSGTYQIMLTFRKKEPDLLEILTDDPDDLLDPWPM